MNGLARRLVGAIAVLAAVAVSGAASAEPAGGSKKGPSTHIVGYFIEWGIYGRQYLVKDVATSGSAARLDVIYQPSSGPAPGVWEAGVDDYKVTKSLLSSGFTRYWDGKAFASWLFDGTTFWTFDDPRVMKHKAHYVRKKGLGGIMFWELSGDT
ncbi:MAG: glycosyl hydrolase family 18 protein, partial [Gaiellaceae bacterium]